MAVIFWAGPDFLRRPDFIKQTAYRMKAIIAGLEISGYRSRRSNSPKGSVPYIIIR